MSQWFHIITNLENNTLKHTESLVILNSMCNIFVNLNYNIRILVKYLQVFFGGCVY